MQKMTLDSPYSLDKNITIGYILDTPPTRGG